MFKNLLLFRFWVLNNLNWCDDILVYCHEIPVVNCSNSLIIHF